MQDIKTIIVESIPISTETDQQFQAQLRVTFIDNTVSIFPVEDANSIFHQYNSQLEKRFSEYNFVAIN